MKVRIVRQSQREASASVKSKIRDLVTEHLSELARERKAGIRTFGGGSYDASDWERRCQKFMDETVLPELTIDEAKAVIRLGLSKLANQCLEEPVRRENKRQEDLEKRVVAPLSADNPGPGRIVSGLIIRPRPLENILSGAKAWEMRSVRTSKRETIALIAQGKKAIYGIADIVDCLGPLTEVEMMRNEYHHGIVASRLSDPEVAKWKFAYVLSNVRRLANPIPFSKSGAVRFVDLDAQARAALQAELGEL